MINERQLRWLADNKRRKRRYYAIGGLLDTIRSSIEDQAGDKLRTTQDLWCELLPAELASLAFPLSLRGDTLMVSVTTTSAKFEIEQIYSPVLVDQLRKTAGGQLRTIKCVLNAAQST